MLLQRTILPHCAYVRGQYNAHTSLAYSPHHILIPYPLRLSKNLAVKPTTKLYVLLDTMA